MKNETARREIESLDYYLQNHTDDYSEESHTAMMMAVKVLDQEPCDDAISRQAVDELSKELVHTTRDKADFLCNFWEGLQKLPSVNPQEPLKPMVEIDLYSVIKQKYIERDVLDKIRAEIEETYMNITYQENKDRKATWGLRKALDIIDKYMGRK